MTNPKPKTAREILEDLIEILTFEGKETLNPNDKKHIDQALNSIADLILAERKEEIVPKHKWWQRAFDKIVGWNSACEHLANKFKGGNENL